MRKSLIIAASLGTVLFSTAAFAASADTSGVIKLIDMQKHTITLADGKVYSLPSGFNAKTLKKGEKVAVVYNLKNNQMMATSVKAAN